ncbi:MAG: ATP synthase F1 subunit delta [Alphaproteobacteria bacterium]|nr:MAG: ATP synthase F1 subunit delta [Alphaproteobacteria bacterium]
MRPKVGILYRYAKAFLLSLTPIQQKSFIKKFGLMLDTLKLTLTHPKYKELSLKKKNQILVLWASDLQLPKFESFVNLLIENNKQASLKDILYCTFELYCDFNKIKHVSVTSAKTLTRKQKSKIQTKFKASDHFTYHINPNIIGGSIIKVEHKIQDTSILTYLQEIQAHLLEVL